MFIRHIEHYGLINKQIIFAVFNTDSDGQGTHWILCVIILATKKIYLIDSLTNLVTNEIVGCSLAMALTIEKCYNSNNINDWEICLANDFENQTNMFDCGVFACINAVNIMNNDYATPFNSLNRRFEIATLNSQRFDSTETLSVECLFLPTFEQINGLLPNQLRINMNQEKLEKQQFLSVVPVEIKRDMSKGYFEFYRANYINQMSCEFCNEKVYNNQLFYRCLNCHRVSHFGCDKQFKPYLICSLCLI